MIGTLLRDILYVSFAYAVGLVVPGYLLARLLGSRIAWACALPLSMGLLLMGVLFLDATGNGFIYYE